MGRPCGHAAGLGIPSQSRRGRHHAPCAAHSRHQPDAGDPDAGDARSAHPAVSRSGPGRRQDRHRRHRQRSDAAQRRRHLHHHEGSLAMARSAQTEGAARRRAAGRRVPGARQQLRVHPADPDALQRADRGRAHGCRGQGVRRRSRSAVPGRARCRNGHGGNPGRAGRGRRAGHRPPHAPDHAGSHCAWPLRPNCRGRPERRARFHRRYRRRSGLRRRPAFRCRRAVAGIRARECRRDRPLARAASPDGRRDRLARLRSALLGRQGRCHHRSQPDQPRRRQAPRRRHRERARARSRLVRRGAAESRAGRGSIAAGILDHLWRNVRASDLGARTPCRSSCRSRFC